MTFGESVKSGFRKYFDFQGRASRSEFWFFYLFSVLVGVAAGLLDATIDWGKGEFGDGPLSVLATIVFFIPGLAVTVRRLHDTGRSAWWIVGFYVLLVLLAVLLVPALGADFKDSSALVVFALLAMAALLIWAFVLMCLPGDPQENRYGLLETQTPVQTSAVRRNRASAVEDTSQPKSHWRFSGFDSFGNVVRLEFSFSDSDERSFIIGRNSTECDLVIPDDGVSRRHAMILVSRGSVAVRDLGSANGTRVNGVEVSSSTPVPLPSSGTLIIGPVELGIFGG